MLETPTPGSDHGRNPDCQSADVQTVRICSHPVFIIGSPRSGTTVLAWSLARHPELWTSDESDVLFHLCENGQLDVVFDKTMSRPSGGWFRLQDVGRSEFLRAIGLGLNALFTSRSQNRRWVDQTPLYTVLSETLADMFPTASFVHILRDGRRVAHSMMNFLRAPGAMANNMNANFVGGWSGDFREACRTWSTYVDAALALERRVPDRCLTVRNELAVADAAGQFRRILEFLRASVSEAPAEFFSSNRINSSFSDDSSDPQWVRRLEQPWREWTIEKRLIFAEEAGTTFVESGCGTREDLELSEEELDIAMLRRATRDVVPTGTRVAVISKGDDRLIDIHGLEASHLQADAAGNYLGYHPANCEEAVAYLDEARAKGNAYLIVPKSALWWFSYYTSFRAVLDERYRLVARGTSCAIYRLSSSSDNGCA